MRCSAHWLFVAGWLLGGCEPETTSESVLPESTETEAITFTIQTPGPISEYEEGVWSVLALDALGQIAESYSGDVEVSVTPGYGSVSTIRLEGGTGTEEFFIGVPGEVRVEVSDGSVSGQTNLTVGPPGWDRSPSSWVLSGVVDRLDHWAYGGVWGGTISGLNEEWVGLFLTTAGQGLESLEETVVSRWVSADQGASWELSPDEPVLVGVEAVAWVEGTWSLFTLDEETRTLQRWSSPDQGVTWVADSCSFVLANNGWSNAGVSNLSVIETGEDRYRFSTLDGWMRISQKEESEKWSLPVAIRMQTIDWFYPPGIRGSGTLFPCPRPLFGGKRVSGR